LTRNESFYFYLLGYGHYQKGRPFEAAEKLKKAIGSILSMHNIRLSGPCVQLLKNGVLKTAWEVPMGPCDRSGDHYLLNARQWH